MFKKEIKHVTKFDRQSVLAFYWLKVTKIPKYQTKPEWIFQYAD